MRMLRNQLPTTALLTLLTVSVACGRSDLPNVATGAGSCADIAIFEGREYTGRNVVRRPSPGQVLGRARLPACDNPDMPSPLADEFVQVARLPGVDPGVAIVDVVSPQVIYVRSDLSQLPPEVERLFRAPSCDQRDSPIELSGTWLGIVAPDDPAELDMIPPYVVVMLVAESSSPRYVDAEIDILVPPSLGSPLTHEDVKRSLWKAGTLAVRAICGQEGFVAESVEAFPP